MVGPTRTDQKSSSGARSSVENSRTSGNSTGTFQQALNLLNMVMLIQVFCISVQVLLLLLDYALGYSKETDTYVGPPFFFWTFYAWVPQWGMALSLLYLTRSGMRANSDQTSPGAVYRETSSSMNKQASKSSHFVDCDVSVTGDDHPYAYMDDSGGEGLLRQNINIGNSAERANRQFSADTSSASMTTTLVSPAANKSKEAGGIHILLIYVYVIV